MSMTIGLLFIYYGLIVGYLLLLNELVVLLVSENRVLSTILSNPGKVHHGCRVGSRAHGASNHI